MLFFSKVLTRIFIFLKNLLHRIIFNSYNRLTYYTLPIKNININILIHRMRSVYVLSKFIGATTRCSVSVEYLVLFFFFNQL